MPLWIAMLGCAALVGCRAVETRPAPVAGDVLPPVTTVARNCECLPPLNQAIAPSAGLVEHLAPAGHRVAPDIVLASASEVQNAAPAPDPIGAPAAAAEPLSLADLQQLALDNNPTLRQAMAQVNQAQGNRQQVGLYPNPQVVAEQATNNAPLDMFNLFVTQPIVTGSKLQLNQNVAAFDLQSARWAAEAQRRRVLNDVHIRFATLQGARERVAAANELMNLARRAVEVAEQLQAAEEVSQADVLQSRLQFYDAQLLLRDAEFQAAAAWKRLADVVGVPDLPEAPLTGSIDDEFPTFEFDVAYQQLLDRSPLLAAARSRVNASNAQVRREQAQPIPNVSLTGGLGNTFSQPGFMMYTLFMGIDVPIFDRNQGNIMAASAQARTSQAEVARLQLALRNQLTMAFRRYETARNEALMYRDVMLPTARRSLAIVERAYEQGEGSVLRVLSARRDLYQIETGRINALVEQRAAAIEIEGQLLTGGLLNVPFEPIRSNSAGQTATPGYYWK